MIEYRYSMRILALDVGMRRTGVAYLDDMTGIPLPLDTISHSSEEDLIQRLRMLIDERGIDRVIIGLPLLPSGKEGSQSAVSRSIGQRLADAGLSVEYRDERHTTPRISHHKHALQARKIDGDAAAAYVLLSRYSDS